MKPLTIEQLRSLEVGDWVWVEHGIHKFYCAVHNNTRDLLGIGGNTYLDYSDYGTKWQAWKNKEQAETKGEIVELPCEARYGEHLSVMVYMSEDNEVWVSNPYDKRYTPKCRLAELTKE